ncbi:hypothetical protein ACFJGV_13680 [Cnuibacter sp. UC19_7]|uniref:hypothetical protein n=1 Tax=Cnuibacter sp. UC19_7 TaxID=3350166 RepID=UPI00366D6929
MPFRTRELLEEWLDEFADSDLAGLAEAEEHESDPGTDPGLIIVRLRNATPYMFLQPVGPGDPKWAVTFGPREQELVLGSEELAGLASELELAARLCAYLEGRSQEYIRTH